MAKSTKPEDNSGKSKSAGQANKRPARSDGTRETVESVVVAFILAFLVRTFEAEAFVIPTGSMAPTLYGRHIDFTCEQCGMTSMVGASSELHSHFGRDNEYYNPDYRITNALCPNCRFDNEIFDRNSNPRGLPAFKGDRILVNKFPYEFWEPARWDVVVFKYPENPKTNYIKRLVGLPGEEIKIEWGDVFVRKGETEPFRITRKDDPYKQRMLQLLVHDNSKPARKLLEWGWPERWAALQPETADGSVWSQDDKGWQANYQARTFQFDGQAAGEERWIRYRHFVPLESDWSDFGSDRELKSQPLPQLISDFCGYNAYTSQRGQVNGRDDALWVSDLTINFEVNVERADGQLIVELVDGDYRHRCRFDLSAGEATLYYVDSSMKREPPFEEVQLATATTRLKGSGRHTVSFANVDRRLCLWVDDTLVEFDGTTEFPAPAYMGPRDADLAPVGIAAIGGKMTVSKLLLQRDIYYRASKYNESSGSGGYHSEEANLSDLHRHLDDPEAWYRSYSEDRRAALFAPLDADEFFMMGDNSPASQDSRLWPNDVRRAKHRHAVPRTALVGKAFYVYWPHGVPFMNHGRGYGLSFWPVKWLSYLQVAPGTYPEDLDPPEEPYPQFTVPFYPNVGRMHRIR